MAYLRLFRGLMDKMNRGDQTAPTSNTNTFIWLISSVLLSHCLCIILIQSGFVLVTLSPQKTVTGCCSQEPFNVFDAALMMSKTNIPTRRLKLFCLSLTFFITYGDFRSTGIYITYFEAVACRGLFILRLHSVIGWMSTTVILMFEMLNI